MCDIKTVKKYLHNVENIFFKKHFKDRTRERPISEKIVLNCINVNNIIDVEAQPGREREKKFKLWLRMSNRYCLVLIIAFSKKDLYIITGWNTNRKWQGAVQK